VTLSLGTHVVVVGLGPTIHPTACSGVRGWLDPRDEPEDDSGKHLLEPDTSEAGAVLTRSTGMNLQQVAAVIDPSEKWHPRIALWDQHASWMVGYEGARACCSLSAQ
jgi:hypothetical protein